MSEEQGNVTPQRAPSSEGGSAERLSMAGWHERGRERCAELGLDPEAEVEVYEVAIWNVGHIYWLAGQWAELVADLKLHIDNSDDGATASIELRRMEWWQVEAQRAFVGDELEPLGGARRQANETDQQATSRPPQSPPSDNGRDGEGPPEAVRRDVTTTGDPLHSPRRAHPNPDDAETR